MATQHDNLATEFTVELQDTYDIISGETKCLTEGTVNEVSTTGVERISRPTADGLELRKVDAEDQDYQADVVNLDRRWTDFDEYYSDVTVKRADQVKSAIQPNSTFIEVQRAAVNRKADKVLIDAAQAVAYSGKNGTVQNNILADNILAHAGVSFTIGKANDLIERFKTLGRVNDGEEITVLWNARMEKVFKMTHEVASSLYNYEMVLAKGYVDRWGPLKFIRIEDFVKKGVAVTRMLPWTKDGVAGGTNLRCALAYTKKSFTRWRPLTMGGVVTWQQPKRRFLISTDSYVGVNRELDDGVIVMQCAEVPYANTGL